MKPSHPPSSEVRPKKRSSRWWNRRFEEFVPKYLAKKPSATVRKIHLAFHRGCAADPTFSPWPQVRTQEQLRKLERLGLVRKLKPGLYASFKRWISPAEELRAAHPERYEIWQILCLAYPNALRFEVIRQRYQARTGKTRSLATIRRDADELQRLGVAARGAGIAAARYK